jgi:hypothetical protein
MPLLRKQELEGRKVQTRYVHEIPKVTIETTACESHEKVCPLIHLFSL